MFAKYWLPGAVKTRLARSIGDQWASQLYLGFLQTLLRRFADVGDRRVVAYTPAERQAEFADITTATWEVIPQSTGNLGQRMESFFASQLTDPASRLVLIGTDSPTMPRQLIDDAFDALDRHAVVLGPTSDGGYYLVGATGDVPPIFDQIDWSTPAVWSQTVDRLRAVGRGFCELPTWYDVDELADLRKVHSELTRLRNTDPTWNALADQVGQALVDA